MAGLDSARLRKLADELDAEEAEQKRELADAETKEERDEISARIEKLEALNAELTQKLAGGSEPPPPAPSDTDKPPGEDDVEETTDRPRMRRGRKRGQVYQEKPGEPGVVWSGEDEPDLVPLDDEDEDAA